MAILSQLKAIEGFILSQDNQKYIEKMGWFAYSLQEVFSYFILSPRCLYDGSKVAYGGCEWITAHTLLSMRYYPCAIIHALLSMRYCPCLILAATGRICHLDFA